MNYIVTILPNAANHHQLRYTKAERKGSYVWRMEAATEIEALHAAIILAGGKPYLLHRNGYYQPKLKP